MQYKKRFEIRGWEWIMTSRRPVCLALVCAIGRFENLLTSLGEELKLAWEARLSGASDLSLQSVISLLQRADKLANAGQSEKARELLDSASRQVVDFWSFSSVLGIEVLEFARSVEGRKS
jgi:ABC-type uncharacterized transport system involved in gliding motility auxiliary subunit